jgi:hypothetical protein
MSRLAILVFAVAVFLFAPPAKAGCWDYLDLGPATCSGDGGCEGIYPFVFCSFGCVSGTCNGAGNGGFCCGTPFDYAQIFPDGQGSCHGVECGGGLGLPKVKHKKYDTLARHKVDPRAAFLAYRPERMVFVPDNCNHSYSVLIENFSAVALPGGN